jgi:thiol:disulfide interchange protein DsbD
METLKQATALPLFATAIWLVWVYGRLYSPDSVAVANHMARLLCCLLLLALAGWTLHKWSTQWGSTVAVIAIGCIALAIPLSSSSSRENVRWEPYSQARLDQARADGRPVLIDFTAAWCLSCQINEQIVMKAHDIESELSDHHVVTLRADWTQYDPEITRQLTLLGRSGVPAYVIYPANRKKAPDVLPELLTKSLVKDAIVHNGQN